jgi:hypothetical protein
MNARDRKAHALVERQFGLAVRDRLAKADPINAGWQRYLSVSYARLAYAFRKAFWHGVDKDEPAAVYRRRGATSV